MTNPADPDIAKLREERLHGVTIDHTEGLHFDVVFDRVDIAVVHARLRIQFVLPFVRIYPDSGRLQVWLVLWPCWNLSPSVNDTMLALISSKSTLTTVGQYGPVLLA